MKDLIKQILREETSGLSDAEKNAAYKMMNNLTKNYHWYHDTFNNPFEYSEGSIWLINPKTKEWMFELQKSGELYYYYKTHNNFYRYLNMERSDFESFIMTWVNDVLEREVITTLITVLNKTSLVEDVLKNGKQLK